MRRGPRVVTTRPTDNGGSALQNEAVDWHRDLVRPTSSLGELGEYQDAKTALLDLSNTVASFGGVYGMPVTVAANYMSSGKNKYPFDVLANYNGEKDEIYFRREHSSPVSYTVDIKENFRWDLNDKFEREIKYYGTYRALDGVGGCEKQCRNKWGENWLEIYHLVRIRFA